MSYESSDERWQAVLSRDPRADGRFVYAVRTTGIYCRPVCNAKRPSRRNVTFFATPPAAEASGFRPCKKCRPQSPTAAAGGPVERVCRLLLDCSTPPPLDDLAVTVGLSGSQLRRRFQQELGVTPKEFATACRSERFRKQLAAGREVTAAAYAAGFNAISRCHETSDATLGMPPNSYRRNGDGLTIHYALTDCRYGRVLIAATERGACAIEFGPDEDLLIAGLHDRFSAADRVPATAEFGQLVDRVVACLDEPGRQFDVPLDIQGTVFQHRVWRALSEIPIGQTASYGEIAERIGSPRTARAVGNACAANRLAVAVPCHRAVHANGGARSYRWGAEVKQQLLQDEAAAAENA